MAEARGVAVSSGAAFHLKQAAVSRSNTTGQKTTSHSKTDLLPSWGGWFWCAGCWGTDGVEEGARPWADRPSPAERGAQLASSVGSPAGSSAERPGNAARPGRSDGSAWSSRAETEIQAVLKVRGHVYVVIYLCVFHSGLFSLLANGS